MGCRSQNADVASTDLKNEHLNQLFIYQEVNDFFYDEHGKPAKTQKLNQESQAQLLEFEEGFKLVVDQNNKIVGIYAGENFQTEKGISVNDPISKVKKEYGENYYVRAEQGVNVIGYVDHTVHLTLEFLHKNDKVVEIRLQESHSEK